MPDVDDICAILKTPGVIGVDFETTVSRLHDREPCTFQVSHSDGRNAVAYIYQDKAAQNRIAKAVTDSPATLSAHFAIFEMEMFAKMGARPKQLECTYLASRVLRGIIPGNDVDPDFSLDGCAFRELGIHAAKETRSRDWREPLDAEAIEYCIQDVELTRDLWLILSYELENDPDQMSGYRIVADALPAIAQCNLNGLVFDVLGHQQLCVVLQEEMEMHLFTMDIISNGAIVNHNSGPQVSDWLAEQISYEEGCKPTRASMLMGNMIGLSWKITASRKLSLDKNYVGSILHEVEPYWPVIGEYLRARLQYQRCAKLLQAFGPTLRNKIDADGHIRGQLIPHGARTSRQSCRDPNLQNQPAEDLFRAMYKALKKRKIVQADYEQIELVVGCIIADDENMKNVFRLRLDIHSATACTIAGISIEEFSKDNPYHVKLRKDGKPVTFASLYGAMATTIALNSGLPYNEAADLLERWLEAYPGVRRYRDEQPDKAREAGYVQLVSGQKIAVVETSRPAQLINAPVQGSAASVMYRALTRVEAALSASGLDAKLALNVHDEILIDSSVEDAIEAAQLLEHEMTEALYELYPEARDIKRGTAAAACIIDRWDQKDDPQFKLSAIAA